VEFNQVPGWDLPNSTNVTVALGNNTLISALYTRSATLSITPAGGLAASGFLGGPFTPASIAYSLTNSGESALNWSASTSASWLTLSVSSGTLAAGASTSITLSLNASASVLPPGNYSDTLLFTNLANGLGNAAFPVGLVVLHPAVELSSPQLLGGSNLKMTLLGVTGRVYSIVASTNLLNPLTNWGEVRRLTNTGGQTPFTNSLPLSSPTYYRAKEL
jgi:hypothetical protein